MKCSSAAVVEFRILSIDPNSPQPISLNRLLAPLVALGYQDHDQTLFACRAVGVEYFRLLEVDTWC